MINVRNDLVGYCLMSIFLLVAITSLSGCSQAPAIPKEGDEVVWRQSSELIIKAKLGQRREHVIVDARTDHKFYEPEYERFIGQFPIDYDPTPFLKLTEQERIVFEEEYSSKIHAVKSIHPIQFNLVLNGVEAIATDSSFFSNKPLDDINQIKIEIGGLSLWDDIKHTTKYRHERFLKSKLIKKWLYDKQSSDEFGMDCLWLNDDKSLSEVLCFGESTYEKASGVSISITDSNWARATSYEPIYGGIKIKYLLDKSKLKHWKEVDAAIWRLLERWNVSP